MYRTTCQGILEKKEMKACVLMFWFVLYYDLLSIQTSISNLHNTIPPFLSVEACPTLVADDLVSSMCSGAFCGFDEGDDEIDVVVI